MTQLSDISMLRQQVRDLKKTSGLSGLRKEFEERKKAEWAQIEADFDASAHNLVVKAKEQELAQTVLRLFDAGETKKALCAAYGTKDYGTINKLLEQAIPEVRREEVTAWLDDVYTERVGQSVWAIEAHHYGGVTGTVRVYKDDEGYPVVVDGTMPDELRLTKLHQEIAGNEEGDFTVLWAKLAG